MKEYKKNNNSLEDIEYKMKIYSSVANMNNDVANILENEVVIVSDVGFYKKELNSMTDIVVTGGESSVKVGDIVAFYGFVSGPDVDDRVVYQDTEHYLPCNGQFFDSSLYPDLYNVLGTNYTPLLNTNDSIDTGFTLKGVGTNSNSVSDFQNHDPIGLGCYQNNCYPEHCHEVCICEHTHTGPSMSHCHCWRNNFCCCCFNTQIGNSSGSGDKIYGVSSRYSTYTSSSAMLPSNPNTCDADMNICLMKVSNASSIVRTNTITKQKSKNVYFLIRSKP